LAKNSRESGTKANALLCPLCCVEYVEVEFDFEIDNVALHNVKALRCPRCDQEVFTQEQVELIRKSIQPTDQ
jgi:hypothetical protein